MSFYHSARCMFIASDTKDGGCTTYVASNPPTPRVSTVISIRHQLMPRQFWLVGPSRCIKLLRCKNSIASDVRGCQFGPQVCLDSFRKRQGTELHGSVCVSRISGILLVIGGSARRRSCSRVDRRIVRLWNACIPFFNARYIPSSVGV